MMELEEILKNEQGDQTIYLERLLRVLPASDRDTYSQSLLAGFVDHALMLRETVPWCAQLEDPLFFEYVLYPRINDEDLSDHRKLFYDALYPRIKDLAIQDAVLEANRWSHEIATYQEQDDRTASPLTVFRNGSGRCGEESTFVVAALRSVGIPARQIYAPRWSHCNDNHAWVEAYCDGQWRFFGACEPEPVLDKGWFNAAAARAMLVHSRRFSPDVDHPVDGQRVGETGCIAHYNQTHRYALTKAYTFCVTKGGVPVAGASLSLQVLNDAKLMTVATLATDEKGGATAKLGIGDIFVTTKVGQHILSRICRGKEQDGLVLDLADATSIDNTWEEFDFQAPAAPDQAGPILTTEQKRERAAVLAQGSGLRQKRVDGMVNLYASAMPDHRELFALARGNGEEIRGFLQKDDSPLRSRLLRALRPKDLRDVTAAVLEDHLTLAAPYQGSYPEEIFDRYLLCPRVADEMLTPWRGRLAAYFTEAEKENFRGNPAQLMDALQERIGIEDGRQLHPGLYWPPDVALEKGRCDKKSLRVLLVAALRTLGVPARQNPVDGAPEYWRQDRFVPVRPRPMGTVVFRKEPGQKFRYGKAWGLARLEEGEWLPLALEDSGWKEDACPVNLPAGRYRILTTSRLPGGDQLAAKYSFTLIEGEELAIPLRQRSYRVEDHLMSRTVPAFSATALDGSGIDNRILSTGRCALLFWLEEGAEPTEHILNELVESAQELQQLPVEIYFFVRRRESLEQPTLSALLKQWPSIHVGTGDWEDTLESLARQLYCDPDRPPLTIACGPDGKAVYTASGYNVSAVQLLVQILRQLCGDTGR